MSKAEEQLTQDRKMRGSARGLFDTRLAQVKTDLAARSIGGRVKAKAQAEAFKVIDSGIDVAKESKGIIAVTAGAILAWIFRAPLLKAVNDLIAPAPVQNEQGNSETLRVEE